MKNGPTSPEMVTYDAIAIYLLPTKQEGAGPWLSWRRRFGELLHDAFEPMNFIIRSQNILTHT